MHARSECSTSRGVRRPRLGGKEREFSPSTTTGHQTLSQDQVTFGPCRCEGSGRRPWEPANVGETQDLPPAHGSKTTPGHNSAVTCQWATQFMFPLSSIHNVLWIYLTWQPLGTGLRSWLLACSASELQVSGSWGLSVACLPSRSKKGLHFF